MSKEREEMTKKKHKRLPDKGAKVKKLSILDRRSVLFSLLILLALFLIFFYQLIFLNKVWTSPDAQAPAGFSLIGEESIKKDHIYPLWNPYVFCGMPSYGSLTYNPYIYLPNIPLDVVSYLIPLPEMTWLLIYYLLAGIFLFMFLRDRNVHPLASLYGASVFLFTPNLIAVGAYGHGSQLITASFIPLVLFLAARLMRTRKILYLSLLGFVSGFQLLRGHVQIVYYTWLAVGLYALVELIASVRSSQGKGKVSLGFFMVFLGLFLGLTLSAVLYLPVHDYSKYSIRGGGDGGGVKLEYATSWSFSPLEMLTFIVPSFMGFGGSTYWGTMPFTDYPNYMGLVPLLLSILALVLIRTRWTVFLLLLSIFSLLVSFGKHFQGFYTLLYNYLPYFNKFRVPVMILVLVQFSVAVLSGIGLNSLLAGEKRKPGLPKLLLYLSIFLFVVAFLLGAAKDSFFGAYASLVREVRSGFPDGGIQEAFDMTSKDFVKVFTLAGFGFLAIYFFLKNWLGKRSVIFILLGLLTVDLWPVDYRLMNPRIGESKTIDVKAWRDDVIEFLEKDSSIYRVLPLSPNEFQTNRYTAFKIQSVGGYHAAKPRLYQDFLEKVGLTDLKILSMMNVKYLISEAPLSSEIPGLTLVHDGTRKVYFNETYLPRAYFVENVVFVSNEKDMWEELKNQEFDPWREAIVSRAQAFKVEGGGSADLTKYGTNELELNIESKGHGFLVVSDLFYPDWKAYLDGREVQVYQANGIMRGVSVGTGSHTLKMKYESPSARSGLFTSLGSAGVLTILVLVSLIPKLKRFRKEKRA